ncbi:MAG: ROK family protein [Verrucomicrobiota bacterium]
MLIGAIEAGGTKFVLGIGNESGEILERLTIPTESPRVTMAKAANFFKRFPAVEALGVGCFGPIDPQLNSPTYGYITTTPKTAWAHYNIVGELIKSLNVPVAFDTDVNGAILGELTWGAAKGLTSAVYITVGTGIGGGGIVEGRMVHGLLHPEMGHIAVKRYERDGYKGKCPYHRDCLEGMASGPAIEERWGRKCYELTAVNEVWAMEAFYLAQALVNIILIISPERIIMGGGVMKQTQLFPLIRCEVQKQLNGYIQKEQFLAGMDKYIVAPMLGDDAGLCGALALGLNYKHITRC